VRTLRHRVITAPTQRRRYYAAEVSFCYAPRSPSPCPPRLPAACLVPLAHPRLRLRLTHAAASLKSLHPGLRRQIPPQVQVESHARNFLAHHLGRVSISQPLTSPRTARLLLQPYQLRLSFHYTLIPAHVPAFPSSALCCLPTVRPAHPTL
jgi:hypothetical protein